MQQKLIMDNASKVWMGNDENDSSLASSSEIDGGSLFSYCVPAGKADTCIILFKLLILSNKGWT